MEWSTFATYLAQGVITAAVVGLFIFIVAGAVKAVKESENKDKGE